MEEQKLEAQIADLRLSTLEAVARESCAQRRLMCQKIEQLQHQVRQLQPRPHKPQNGEMKPATAPDDIASGTAHVPVNTAAPLARTSCTADDAGHMCDYCFTFAARCFACPHCGREWYCSDVCQRLRQRCHAGRCRASLCPPQDVVATK